MVGNLSQVSVPLPSLTTSPHSVAPRTRRSQRKTANATTSSPPRTSPSPASPASMKQSTPSRAPLMAVTVPQTTSVVQGSPPPSILPREVSNMATTSQEAVFSGTAHGVSSSPNRSVTCRRIPLISPPGCLAVSATEGLLCRMDSFARAQAMGLRLTREEYEQTKAGVTAFLREDRDRAPERPVSRNSSPLLRLARAGAGDVPISVSPSASQSAKVVIAPDCDDEVPETCSATQSASSSWRPHLPFFTAGIPLKSRALQCRPRLDEIGSAEEKRKRKERRRRQRQRNIAGGSVSEPDTSRTPRMSGGGGGTFSNFGGSPLSSSSNIGLVGLGLGSSGSRHSIGVDIPTPETSPLASLSHRARTLSATALPSSSNLQAAVLQSAVPAPPSLTLLNSRARTSSHGRLMLAAGGYPPEQSEHRNAATFHPVMESDDKGKTASSQPLGVSGRPGAAHGGWGLENSPVRNRPAIQKLGLLDRVMRDRGSPTRAQSRSGRVRRASDCRKSSGADFVSMDRIAYSIPTPSVNATTPDDVTTPAAVTISQLGPPFPVNTHPGSNIAYAGKESLRRRSHSRQMSQAGKSVRWAPTVTSANPSTFTPGHQRMTTRDHYEFFVNGVSPDTSVDLSGLVVDQPPYVVADAAQASMPWLYGSHPFMADGEVNFSTFRIDEMSNARSPSRTSLTAEDFGHLGSSIDSMYEHEHQDRRQSVNGRRDLLFGSSTGSPNHSTVNRFNPGFSDPALSQSPQRSSVASGRHTRGKSSLGSIRDLFSNGQSAVTKVSDASSHFAGPSLAPHHPRAGIIQHPQHPTVSPAAIFGGALASVPAQGVHNPSIDRASVLPRTSVNERLLEPTKARGGTVEQDDQKDQSRRLHTETMEYSGQAETTGLARVRSGGVMDWGAASLHELPGNPSEMAPRATPAAAKLDHHSTASISKGRCAVSPVAVSSADCVTPVPRRTAPVNIGPLPLDPRISEWVRPDGSRVVKLVSEELQAALESGGFEEPPPRYYVLPAGSGATKAKPPHVSYAGLIGQAILTSSDQRLSLAEIYNWISIVHPFFERGDRGWQNSIRHNLSLNKSFIKVEREANIPGKGGWWAIKEGHEERFKEGLYCAGPGGTVERSDLGSNNASSSKKSKKKLSGGQEADDTRASTQLPSDETQGSDRLEGTQLRKRQISNGNAAGHIDTCPSSPQRSIKAHKKPKLAAGPAPRLPLSDVTNRHLTGGAANVVQYSGMFSATPSRRRVNDQRYMASSGGMPALTDCASSPPASPALFDSDVPMPPPPSTKRKAARRASQQGRLSFFNGPGPQAPQEHPAGIFGVQQYQSGQNQQQQYTNLYFNGNGVNSGVFYPSQPSPLAGRWRNPSTDSTEQPVNGSPLRRSTTSPSKRTTHSPISSMRESASSALAGAMSIGSSTGIATHRRTGSGLGSSVTVNGQPFFVQHNPFQQSILVKRSSPAQRLSGRSDMPLLTPAAGTSLQVAVGQKMRARQAQDAMAPPASEFEIGGTPTTSSARGRQSDDKGTLNARTITGPLISASPSPGSRRHQVSHSQLGWLENPYDYQDALQRELEGMSSVASISAAGHPTRSPHYGLSMSGTAAIQAVPAPMGLMASPNASPTRLGSGWLSIATQQDNISAVRGSSVRSD